MSFLTRLSTDAANAYQDVYSNWILGDDAGKSALLTLVLRQTNSEPNSSSNNKQHRSFDYASSLGMTFLEVNGRAYVYRVIEGSAADEAGVMPQDAIQYATVVRPEWVSKSDGNQQNDNIDEHSLAVKYVLDLEKKGARIGYDQLRHLLVHKAMLSEKVVNSAFLSPSCTADNGSPANRNKNSSSTWNGPPIPSNVCIPITRGHFHDQDVDDITITDSVIQRDDNGSSVRNRQLPVVFVFRRTRQRKSFLQMGLLPAFRLDDECDLASSLVRRLAPSPDMDIPPPDTWEELVHDGTDWLLGNGSILPPILGSGSGKGVNGLLGAIEHNGENKNPQTGSPSRRRKKNLNANFKKVVDDRDYGSPPDATRVSSTSSMDDEEPNNNQNYANHDEEDEFSRIPLDEFEKDRAVKVANLRSRMAAEARQVDRSDDVEAATIRGMIQKAVGLAFIRASKVVLGVSFHGGSGIVIARLGDGTWSAPSAIGTWGLGFGIQFGLEVAEYIFILQTQEALDHFKKGGSYTVGGNMGVAFAGLGREAYGAASVGGTMCGNTDDVDEDRYNDNDSRKSKQENKSTTNTAIAPIVAYAKSQGLYIGVSLEGSRIFTRDDINSRVYKFTTSGREVTANDILTGKVATPPEAEGLYAALHSVEFAHEMSCLPRPPEILRRDANNPWQFDRCTLTTDGNDHVQSTENGYNKQKQPFSFLPTLNSEERDKCEAFEAQFKNFLYGGVSVQRLLPNDTGGDNSGRRTTRNGRTPKTRKERRTLWLMLPEVGSLRLGFVSKLSDGENVPLSNLSSTRQSKHDDRSRFGDNNTSNDVATVGSEELTLDSAIQTKDGSITGPIRIGNVQMSDTHSVALTDITSLSQEPAFPVRFKENGKNEHLRVISIQDVAGTSIVFLANNFREAELLICGLKLLLERETTRLGVRGGLPMTALGGRSREGVMSPAAARGFREIPSKSSTATKNNLSGNWQNDASGSPRHRSRQISTSSPKGDDSIISDLDTTINDIPEGRKKWSTVPGRDYMRGQAEANGSKSKTKEKADNSGITFVHGELVRKAILKNIRLSLPLHQCRIFLLDSSSPVMLSWENDRKDINFERSGWIFPTNSPRHHERHPTEQHLIASGSMTGAYRTINFDRPRYGSMVRLSEVHAVEVDDSRRVALSIVEQNPRRGFSVTVKIFLRAHRDNTTDTAIYADFRPIGKDMSNQTAVMKAFNLVVEEIQMRYGEVEHGFMRHLCEGVDKLVVQSRTSSLMVERSRLGSHSSKNSVTGNSIQKPFKDATPVKPKSGLVSLADMLQNGRESPETVTPERPSTPSIFNQIPNPNPAVRAAEKKEVLNEKLESQKEPVLIEVKPLPKIRLSLMPPPREEDEYDSGSVSGAHRKDGDKKTRRRSSSGGKRRSKTKSSASKHRVTNV